MADASRQSPPASDELARNQPSDTGGPFGPTNFKGLMSVVDFPSQKQRPAPNPRVEPSRVAHPTLPPPPPSGRRSNRQKALLGIGGSLTVLLLVVAMLLAEGLRIVEDSVRIPEMAPLTPIAQGQAANWLLVGSDSREGFDANDPNAGYFIDGEVPIGRRTDTMIIARVDSDNGTVDILSVPRDLWVEIDGEGRSGRVNSAFASDDGRERLTATISKSLGIEINHYAEINFFGFQDVVDELGGVTMWFDTPMRDLGSGLLVETPGCVNLEGFQALAFARGRTMEFQRTDGTWVRDTSGDLGRITRQQYFLKRVADSAAAVKLSDVATLTGLIRSLEGKLFVSSSIGIGDMADLAREFSAMSGEEITTHTLPVTNFRTTSGAAVLAMQPAEADQVLAIFRGEEPEPILPEELAVELIILNGSRVPGQAKTVESWLARTGKFDIEKIDNGPTSDTTKLIYGPGMEAGAERVARYLEVEPEFEPDPDAVGLTLLTGVDFDGIRAEPLGVDAFDAPPAPGAPAASTAPSAIVVEEQAPVGILPDRGDKGACS